MTSGEHGAGRVLIAVAGAERRAFLQGLVTNDVARLETGLVWAALLSPQGKYLADFFLVPEGAAGHDAILLDVAAGLADGLERRLGLYRLRARVSIGRVELPVARGLGAVPAGAFADPRHPAMGWRGYGLPDDLGGGAAVDWDAIRVGHVIPEGGVELLPDETYPLEAGFERLNGVDFRKGCYVGQEVTARMKHKTELRKGLVQVAVDGTAPVGTPILAGERPAGTLFTQSGGRGMAHLRLDRADGALRAGEAAVRYAAEQLEAQARS